MFPQAAPDVGNDRHQHSFEIYSNVRMGCMRSEIYRFTEKPDGAEHEFAVRYEKGCSTLTPTGRTGVLEAIAAFESRAGSSYSLNAGIIHRVSVLVRPCITFLTTVERSVPIFSYGNDVEEPAFERRFVNDAETDEIVRLLHLVETESQL
jgi:hypothetical protein